ncbi:hypothetical protein N752_29520 [Desulforamulus aquiferis]|nr:hypothetical protein N752_29520 [Desulforamulus aquiferis]
MLYISDYINNLNDEGKDIKTVNAYRTILSQFINWYATSNSDLCIAKIKPIDIKDYISYLKHRLQRRQSTINKSIACLKTYFSYLIRRKLIANNPMINIKIQKQDFLS